MKSKLSITLILVGAMFLNYSVCFGADCGKALFHPDYGVFAHEGGYQNSKNDPGNYYKGVNGGTKYGIAYKYHHNLDIKNLTKEQAVGVYEADQCKQVRMDDLKGQRAPTLMLDFAVNMGTETAIKLIIKALDFCEGKTWDPKTRLVMTDEVVRRYNEWTFDINKRREFMFVLVLYAMDRYCDIVQSNPKMATWLLGWIVRANPLND